MKRIASVCSWIMVVLFLVAGIAPFILDGVPSGAAVFPAVVYAVALAAFHFRQKRWLRTFAMWLNGFSAVVVVLFVAFGVNFDVGANAILAAVGFSVLLAAPALLNAIALLRVGIDKNATAS